MKTIISLIALLFVSYLVNAQYENFDLSKYKLPDIKRHELDFSLNARGNNSKEFYDSEFFGTSETKRNDFLGGIKFNYDYYQNSERMQSSVYSYFATNYISEDNSGSNASYERDYNQLWGSMNLAYRMKYFFEKKWFLTASPQLRFSFHDNNDKLSNHGNDSNSFDTEEFISIGGGKGRIEQVQDYRHALLLLKEFDKRGVSKRALSESETFEFAQLISAIKNKRFFDSRKRLEKELHAIDSFLVSKDVVEQTEIDYFIGMQDIWNFGALQIREKGNQFMVSIQPGYFNDKTEYTDLNVRSRGNSMNYLLSYTSKNPLSIKWQADYSTGLSHSHKNYSKHWDDFTKDYFVSTAYANATLGFYPNTRTSLFFKSDIRLTNEGNKEALKKGNYNFLFNIKLQTYYYISERLRLSGQISFDKTKYALFDNDELEADSHYLNYNLTLNYSIF